MSTSNAGNVTLATLGAIVIVGSFVGISVTMTANTARVADRSQDMAIVQAAAEGAIEQAYGLWKAELSQQYRSITGTEAMATLSFLGQPSFAGATYAPGGNLSIKPTDSYGAPMKDANGDEDASASPTATFVNVPNYRGWKGRNFGYVASARLQSLSSLGTPVKYGVKRNFSYTEVPLFQSMFFFEHDFELYRSNTMNITGLSHTNSWAFVSYDAVAPFTVTFQNYASFVLGWKNTALTRTEAKNEQLFSDNDLLTPYRINTWAGWGGNIDNNPNRNREVIFANGASNQLSQVNRLEPLGNDPSTVLDPLPTNASLYAPSGQFIGPDGDSDGNPDNDSFHEIIEPPVNAVTDHPAIAKRRLYNKAGIVVTIDGSTKTVTSQNGTSLSPAAITTIKNAISTTTIYDKREQTSVRVQNIDMSAIRTTLDAASGFNGVLYVQDQTATSAGTPKNAIRLDKGGELPTRGLTVASPNGIYIKGDYNTGTTTSPTAVPSNNGGNAANTDAPTVSTYTRKPAAVIGDAVMILSNSWSDANDDHTISSRVASNTTVNAALLGGFIPSGYKPASGAQYGYSGGANNYPRFLEDWNGKYMTYFGSMVELFQSKDFSGKWDTGDIYLPPIRCWNYDTNFDSTPPPGSIDAVATSRGTWTRY